MAAARRAYKCGAIIHFAMRPFVKCLSPKFRSQYCNNCFMRKALTVCDCKMVYYCGEHCELKDKQNGHELECKSKCYREFCSEDPDSTRCEMKLLLFRIYAQILKNEECVKAPFKLHDNTTTCFNDVVGSRRSLKQPEHILELAYLMVYNLKRLDNVEVAFDKMVEYASVFFKNCFPIYEDKECVVPYNIGRGIYLQLGVFKHSCKPTAHLDNFNHMMQLRAVVYIPKRTRPLINYLSFGHAMDRTGRQRMLFINYHFLCYCSLCDSENDADVDYKKLQEDLEELRKIGMVSTGGLQWTDLNTAKDVVVNTLRKICHQYDPRITNVFTTVMVKAMRFRVNSELLKDVHQDTLNRLKQTFGEESSELGVYREAVASYSR